MGLGSKVMISGRDELWRCGRWVVDGGGDECRVNGGDSARWE